MLTLAIVLALAADPPADATAKAEAFVATLAKGDYAAAGKDFTPAVRKALPDDKLQALWESLTKQAGPFGKTLGSRTEKRGPYQIVFVSCEFAKTKLDVRVTFDAEQKIAGLGFIPPTPPYQPPAYVQADKFRESEVKVGAGTSWELPGTLSLPVGDGPFPAVVLVHGSGPNDRDETVGGAKPFRDLAGGLASRGVAVLRYEKRTRQHGPAYADKAVREALTVQGEVIDDALVAAALLRKTPRIDPKRVFLLGHSLGGTMAPKIASLDPQLAGIIVLAGATRPLEDLVLEQFTYIYGLNGGPTDEQKAELAKLKERVARVKDPKLSPETPAADLPLGQAAAYWLALRGYEPAAVAATLKVPVLVLHGGRDYQVTDDDFALWQKALAGQPHATLKRYDSLNHLFIEGQGKATPAEYQKPGHVAAAVIDDIAAWVKGKP
jgi:uncharacterized protein